MNFTSLPSNLPVTHECFHKARFANPLLPNKHKSDAADFFGSILGCFLICSYCIGPSQFDFQRCFVCGVNKKVMVTKWYFNIGSKVYTSPDIIQMNSEWGYLLCVPEKVIKILTPCCSKSNKNLTIPVCWTKYNSLLDLCSKYQKNSLIIT